jgi:metallophosphoesterase superfamily enzyme|tara:strand:- start:14083 stop:14901 length:819 start_codon:yes stop_codon:yes gene_type:complete
MYSLKKAKEIYDSVVDIGIAETSQKYGISAESVKRAVRELKLKQNMPSPIEQCVVTGGRKVLCIGDLHCPFDLDGYLDFCTDVYQKHICDTVVFIGDVIDNHYASYHESDPDGLGGREELECAIERLAPYYKAFPDAYVTIGNHDRIIMRKSMTSSVPRRWIKSYAEVLETPGWKFTDEVSIDEVMYIHGEVGNARIKSINEMCSVVQGHRHTEMFTHWTFGKNRSVFGCQVGCGIDFESYAMGYAKRGKKPAIGCAVIIDGTTCINEVMPL